MNSPYEDIIRLPRPVSRNYPPLSPQDRAAQFAPFAALDGHGAAIAETARVTQRPPELDEDARAELEWQLALLLERGESEFTATWCEPDGKKEGGRYVTASGRLRKLDTAGRALLLTDGTRIPLDGVVRLTLPDPPEGMES